MSEQKTHWKKLRDPKYLGEWDFLPGQELKVTFEKVGQEKTFNPNTQQEQNVSVAYFKEGKKGLIINATNAKIISALVGSPYLEDWIGHSVILMVAKTRIRGEVINSIRVKNQKV